MVQRVVKQIFCVDKVFGIKYNGTKQCWIDEKNLILFPPFAAVRSAECWFRKKKNRKDAEPYGVGVFQHQAQSGTRRKWQRPVPSQASPGPPRLLQPGRHGTKSRAGASPRRAAASALVATELAPCSASRPGGQGNRPESSAGKGRKKVRNAPAGKRVKVTFRNLPVAARMLARPGGAVHPGMNGRAGRINTFFIKPGSNERNRRNLGKIVY